MEELPSMKALVQRLEKKPFALLGLDTDADEPKGSLAKKLAAKGVTWRQGMLGSTDHALPTLWDIRGYPTKFVLDEEGVIRSTDARGEELARVVDECLARLDAKTKTAPKDAPKEK